MASWLASAAGASLLAYVANSWQQSVNRHVPDPYLDEVFHIRQAQVYCQGNFHQWDPKITTPPGVYMLSWLLYKTGMPCDVKTLRLLNQLASYAFLFPVVFLITYGPWIREPGNARKPRDKSPNTTLHAVHTAINVCLFPPLFFFSGLYYTDVTSTCMVLLFTFAFQNRNQLSEHTLGLDLCIFTLGAASLLFRQTNIFWVAVYPAALHFFASISEPSSDSSSSSSKSSKPTGNPKTRLKSLNLFKASALAFRERRWHDTPLDSAMLNDFILMLFTLIPCIFSRVLNPSSSEIRAFLRLWPYVLLLAGFGAFVFMNGGVVLGDKSNHIATIHLPQLLYLWPFISLFSFPLILPHLVGAVTPKKWLPSALQPYSKKLNFLNLSLCLIIFLSAALPAVHYNTIVHPFTLADNRHYVFYVFRLLLKHPAIKYLVTPVYFACMFGALLALHQPSDDPAKISSAADNKVSLSWFIVWLACTGLCLISAPLVEPRYLILPWIFWRLKVPPSARKNNQAFLLHGDWSLLLETVWFLAINAWTVYMFLYRGFAWPQEPGLIQRFMW